ncbi:MULTISPECIES: thioesterase family protein [unclassified Streptomyces]|uniref:acyl-CoA thioesterase n=1 Tax=unclassified Streptomyces TaxID=2593676 RepID=UPI000DB9E4BA|nr:thioesterase family protein [Streptomyces sp. PsTaAH-137]MYT71783.1 thioesterase [Streptomyces sp. SID8367]RAJ72617.1 acyl-CoA thioester hydrolase [Streptomyces sp. PsTaAH-137]
MAEPFSVRVEVRGYETDTQGHLNQAVYLQYAEHARWALLRHGGIEQQDLLTRRVGPVVLETNIRYLRELRAGDSVDVECVFEWGEGKTFRVLQAIRKTDGTLSAEITGVGGVLDLDRRKLVADPGEVFKELAKDPGAFGL